MPSRIRIHTIANDKTGTLYVILFGAPESEWDKAWKIGKTMLNPIFLDDEI